MTGSPCTPGCFSVDDNPLQRVIPPCAPFLGAYPAPFPTPRPSPLRDHICCPVKHGYASTHLGGLPPSSLIPSLLLLCSYLWDLEPVCGLLDFVFVLGHTGVWTSSLSNRLLVGLLL